MATKTTSLTVKQKKERRELLADRRQEIEGLMTPELLAMAKKFESDVVVEMKRGFGRRWEWGKELKAIRDDCKKYGKDGITMMASYLGYERSILDKVINFHESFTKAAVDTLTERRMAISDRVISWAHIEVLLTIKDVKQRAKLLDEVYEEDLTAKELDDMQRTTTSGGRKKRGGGRPARVPATLTARLENFATVCHVLTRNEKLMWRNDEFGFLTSVEKMPADKITPQLLQKFEEDLSVADRSITALTAVKVELESALDTARRRLEQQSRQQGVEESEDVNGKSRSRSFANA